MRHMKKVASLLLALVMVLSLMPAALAAGTGSITVDNPIAGQTYTAYKIFDVSYDAGKTAYSYTIKKTSEWFDTVNTYASDLAKGLTLTQVNGSDTYVVTIDNSKFSAPSFALALKADVDGKDGTTLELVNGKATATGLDLGYYFVTSTSGALCNLTTTNPSVTIHDKNDNPFDKVDDKESVDVGEVVTYTITGKVPDTTGFTTYTYMFTDTMSDGLTFQKDVKVKIGDTDVTAKCTITYDVDGNSNKFTVTVPVIEYQGNIGSVITVTYTAIVNENAIANVEKNHADLTYSNDPTNSESKTTTPPDEETVYSSKLVIDKYAAETETKLAGAQFILYKEVTKDGTTQKVYYKWDATNKKVVWVENKGDATVKTTDDKGAASFDGLADGTYYLEEIAAPAGYNMMKDPVQVVIAGSNSETTKLTTTEKVANSTGTELPSTGGMGTTVFYVLGSVLVLGAVVLLVTKKRMGGSNA